MTDAHIKHGFLAMVYEPWVRFEGSEWGNCMGTLWEAYDMGYIWSDEEFEVLEKVLRDHLQDAADSFFFDEDDMYQDEVLAARLEYPNAVESWRKRAEEFGAYKTREKKAIYPDAITTFEETERAIPDWMKPPEDDDVKEAQRRQLTARRDEMQAKVDSLNGAIEDLA